MVVHNSMIRNLMISCSLVALLGGAVVPHAFAGVGKDDEGPSKGISSKPKGGARGAESTADEANAQRLSQAVQKLGLKPNTTVAEAGKPLRALLQKENYSPEAVKAVMDGFLGKSRLHSLKLEVLDAVRKTNRTLTVDEARMGLEAAQGMGAYLQTTNNPALVEANNRKIQSFQDIIDDADPAKRAQKAEAAKIEELTQAVQKLGLKPNATVAEAGPKLRGFLQSNGYSPAAVKAVMDGFLGASRLFSLKVSLLEKVQENRPLNPLEARLGMEAAQALLKGANTPENKARLDKFQAAAGGKPLAAAKPEVVPGGKAEEEARAAAAKAKEEADKAAAAAKAKADAEKAAAAKAKAEEDARVAAAKATEAARLAAEKAAAAKAKEEADKAAAAAKAKADAEKAAAAKAKAEEDARVAAAKATEAARLAAEKKAKEEAERKAAAAKALEEEKKKRLGVLTADEKGLPAILRKQNKDRVPFWAQVSPQEQYARLSMMKKATTRYDFKDLSVDDQGILTMSQDQAKALVLLDLVYGEGELYKKQSAQDSGGAKLEKLEPDEEKKIKGDLSSLEAQLRSEVSQEKKAASQKEKDDISSNIRDIELKIALNKRRLEIVEIPEEVKEKVKTTALTQEFKGYEEAEKYLASVSDAFSNVLNIEKFRELSENELKGIKNLLGDAEKKAPGWMNFMRNKQAIDKDVVILQTKLADLEKMKFEKPKNNVINMDKSEKLIQDQKNAIVAELEKNSNTPLSPNNKNKLLRALEFETIQRGLRAGASEVTPITSEEIKASLLKTLTEIKYDGKHNLETVWKSSLGAAQSGKFTTYPWDVSKTAGKNPKETLTKKEFSGNMSLADKMAEALNQELPYRQAVSQLESDKTKVKATLDNAKVVQKNFEEAQKTILGPLATTWENVAQLEELIAKGQSVAQDNQKKKEAALGGNTVKPFKRSGKTGGNPLDANAFAAKAAAMKKAREEKEEKERLAAEAAAAAAGGGSGASAASAAAAKAAAEASAAAAKAEAAAAAAAAEAAKNLGNLANNPLLNKAKDISSDSDDDSDSSSDDDWN